MAKAVSDRPCDDKCAKWLMNSCFTLNVKRSEIPIRMRYRCCREESIPRRLNFRCSFHSKGYHSCIISNINIFSCFLAVIPEYALWIVLNNSTLAWPTLYSGKSSFRYYHQQKWCIFLQRLGFRQITPLGNLNNWQTLLSKETRAWTGTCHHNINSTLWIVCVPCLLSLNKSFSLREIPSVLERDAHWWDSRGDEERAFQTKLPKPSHVSLLGNH
jgi:hypothetical protein